MKAMLFKPRLADIVFIAILTVALALGSQMLSLDSDLGRHLALGDYMLNARIIPTVDLFSHTRAGLARPPYEWGAQILFAVTNRLLGLDGVILFTALVIATTFYRVYQFASHRSNSPVLALLIVLIAAGASSIHWLPRPHIFTFLFLPIWVEYLERLAQDRPIKLYLFPLLMLLWANLHGGFVFGILTWFAYFVGWLWDLWHKQANTQTGQKLLIIGITSAIATIITPDLWHNWDAVLNNHSTFILNRTVETMRPNLFDAAALPYTALLLLTTLLFVANWRTIKARQVFLLAGLGLMSLFMARNIPLYALVCTPILAELGNKTLSKFKTWAQIEARFAGFSVNGHSVWIVAIASIAIGYFAYHNFQSKRSIYQFASTVFPTSAVAYILANPQQGNMFNDFNWGGYLEYTLWPCYSVFLDSQSDFYGEPLIREYDQITAAKGNWKELLNQHHIEWAIISSRAPLTSALQDELGWAVLYQDTTATILRQP